MDSDVHSLGERYRIIDSIVKGSTSIILRAQDMLLDRLVALKMPRENLLSENPEYARMFIKEAKYLASFDHPNILPLYDCYESSQGPVLVMRYAEGSLRTYISNHNLTIESAVRTARQVADALDYCTGRGVAHRDVKPENVLLGNISYSYLGDFGLAAHLDDDDKWNHVMGTPPYVCPEILFESRISSTVYNRAKSDQFSFGVMLYEMITGHLPFELPSPRSCPPGWEYCTALRLWKGERPLSCCELDPRLPHGLDEVIMRMLSLDHEERYPSNKAAVESFAETLEGRTASGLRVFISFSHEDIHIARALVPLLEEQGFSVWWDTKISHAGDWDDQIEAAMLSSQVMILLLSGHSVKSSESKREWKYWLDFVKKPIIPILLENCMPSYRLSPLQHISAVGMLPPAIASEICQAIRKTIGQAQDITSEGTVPVGRVREESLLSNMESMVLKTLDLRSHELSTTISTQVPAKYKISRDDIERCLETQH